MDEMNNVSKFVTYEVEVNIYYKRYIKYVQMSIYNLGRTDMILEIL